eukprot:386847-Amphidinium_carterae.1
MGVFHHSCVLDVCKWMNGIVSVIAVRSWWQPSTRVNLDHHPNSFHQTYKTLSKLTHTHGFEDVLLQTVPSMLHMCPATPMQDNPGTVPPLVQ